TVVVANLAQPDRQRDTGPFFIPHVVDFGLRAIDPRSESSQDREQIKRRKIAARIGGHELGRTNLSSEGGRRFDAWHRVSSAASSEIHLVRASGRCTESNRSRIRKCRRGAGT